MGEKIKQENSLSSIEEEGMRVLNSVAGKPFLVS